ncbi:MAG TPA: FHA domain-containing protein [Thermoleophilaceae bacterium]
MSQATLAIVQGVDAGREFSVTGTTVVGRDRGADVVIADTEVSTKHAAFDLVAGGIAVQDLGSTNGTFVNGQRVTGSHPLQPGDQVQIGATVVQVRQPVEATAEQAGSPPGAQITHGRRIPALPVLEFVAGQYAGTEMPVGAPIVVGRDPGVADVVLDQDSEISRRHTSFSPAGAGLVVQDLGSTNGTIVNGHRLDYAVTLGTGDQAQMGQTIVKVRLGEPQAEPAPAAVAAPVAAAAPGAQPNDIVAEALVKEFGSHRAVDQVNLYVNPAEIYGFLGPNGAGKSTTVHMLTTLLPPSGGRARIAGYDVATEGASVRSSIGVALQAAALDPNLNAWEHMDLQTALQGLPRAQRRARGEDLLERVGLTDAADRRVGGYSGGMKRRLDLALALVHWPRVLFLDEPTTGLDPQSRTALWEEVARLVREEGMTVFLTTQYLEEADIMADRVGIIDHGEIVAEGSPAALKEEIGRPTVEVLPLNDAEWAAVSQVLESFGELVSTANRGVAARLRPGVDDLADVVRALDSRGLRVANLQLHAPTLDDVFLVKTGRSLEGAAEEDEAPAPDALELNAGAVPGATGQFGSY